MALRSAPKYNCQPNNNTELDGGFNTAGKR
jgi:hypothetical protein